MVMAAKDLGGALWPVDRNELEREDVRDRMYERVINAFDNALVFARREAGWLCQEIGWRRWRILRKGGGHLVLLFEEAFWASG